MIFHSGDGTSDTVAFVLLQIVTPDWFRRNLVSAIVEMCEQGNWRADGDASVEFARDKSVEMLNSLIVLEESPLPVFAMPIGSIVGWPSTTIPAKWLECNGQTLNNADYPELYALIGTHYGGGVGIFTLPNFRRKFPIGADPQVAGYHLYDLGGEENHQLSVAELPVHNHGQQNHSGSGSAVLVSTTNTGGTGQAALGSTTTANVGSGTPHNNIPPFSAINYIIYAGR